MRNADGAGIGGSVWARSLVFLLALLFASAPAAQNPPSFADEREVVETLHTALLDTMQRAKTEGASARRAALVPVLDACFDFAFMAEKSAGRHWRGLSPGERADLEKAMEDLAATNYATRFDGHEGERFITTGAEVAPYDTVLVHTEIKRSDEVLTRLDYRLHRDASGTPKIVDVFLNGTVSELAMRRAEYSSVIKRDGFPALLEALRDRVSTIPVSASGSTR